MEKGSSSEFIEGMEEKVKLITNMLKADKAKALGMAVMLTISTALVGCTGQKTVDESYILGHATSQVQNNTPAPNSMHGGGSGVHGGSYYYSRGSSYQGGSWGNTSVSKGGIGSSSFSGKGAGG